jgi:hypothetical protein
VRFFQGKDSLVGDIGELIAEQMHKGVKALADFFGFSKEEFDLWLVDTVESIEKAAKAFGQFFSDIWDEANALEWDDVFDAWQSVWSQSVNWLKKAGKATGQFFSDIWDEANALDWNSVFDSWKSIWTGFIGWLKETWNGFANWLTGLIDRIPFVGGLVKKARDAAVNAARGGPRKPRGSAGIAATSAGIQRSLTNVVAGINLPIQQQASSGTLQTINQTRSLQNTVNNVSQGRGPVSVQMTNHITQQPGESGEALARRIQGGVRKEFANAIRDNDTGVDY